jgi:hypothetical protein
MIFHYTITYSLQYWSSSLLLVFIHLTLPFCRSSSTLSLTSALDGVGGQRHAPAGLPSGKTRYPLYRRLGGRPRRSGRVRKISPPSGFDFRTVQSVVSRCTDWTIPSSTVTYDVTKCTCLFLIRGICSTHEKITSLWEILIRKPQGKVPCCRREWILCGVFILYPLRAMLGTNVVILRG